MREEEDGDDDGEDDEDQRDRCAGGAVFDLRGEPVVGPLGDYGQDDGSYDGGEEGLQDESTEDQYAEGEEEESDLPPGYFFSACGHAVGSMVRFCFIGWSKKLP